ncbi:uncharacterized protein [Nicotiana tomentosiformis]|uniref:uncharacterized protein n=1 Tax=Nicotiana tomentosiformis TaxID=4098 RepID=UPI00388CCD26
MSVREYNLQFDSLARYALTIVAMMEDQVHQFVMGLDPHLLNDWKANIVADALSRRSMGSLSYLQPDKSRITHEIHQLAILGVRLLDPSDTGVTIQDTTISSLVTEVKECSTRTPWLHRQVMGETHYSRYSVHPGVTKMYHDIREIYWWDGMKKDIAKFVAQCPNC